MLKFRGLSARNVNQFGKGFGCIFIIVIQSPGFSEWLLSTLFDASLLELKSRPFAALFWHQICFHSVSYLWQCLTGNEPHFMIRYGDDHLNKIGRGWA